MRTVGSIAINSGEFHTYSIKMAYSRISTEALKVAAQKMREQLDWKFDSDIKTFYDCAMEVVHIVDPSFETEFIPGQ